MIAEIQTAFAPVGIALGIVAVCFGVCVLLGKGIKRADDELGDDGADVPFGPDTERAIEQNLALVNSRPLVEAIVDELAQRRSVAR